MLTKRKSKNVLNKAYEVGTDQTVMLEFQYESDKFDFPDKEHMQVSRGLESNSGKAFIIKTLLN